jgi:hypothetical protein
MELTDEGALVIVMVGLPARGKSFISLKLKNYLNWLGLPCEIFNLGNKRRQMITKPLTHEFYDLENKESFEIKEKIARLVFADMVEYLAGRKRAVAIYDGTNSTLSRRKWIREECEQRGFRMLLVESICDQEEIIAQTILKCKQNNDDYKGREDIAVTDFWQRIRTYEKSYKSLQPG